LEEEEIAEPLAAEAETAEEVEAEEPAPVVPAPAAKKPRAATRRIVVVEQPEIDWLWYERNPQRPAWGWVDSEESSDDGSPPADLWWNRNSQHLVEEK